MEEREKKPRKVIKNVLLFLIFALIIICVFIFPSKKGQIRSKVKSSLEKVVEKSDLETVNITYNVIAKQCKNDEECDKTSNKIEDFKYVVSCKGTVTAGIDFSDVKITVDDKLLVVTVTMPEATLKGEPSIGSVKFLNGDEVSASELPNARRLCQETVKEKSEADGKLMPAAKEQARVVLEEFYKQWIKAYDSSYAVVVK